MATYKVVDADQLNADMTSVADSIRTKGGTTEALAWPSGYKAAIDAIQTGGGGGGGSEEEWIGDGNTHIWITLGEGRTSPMLGCCPNGTVTVDWGDGTTPDVLTGTSVTSVKWTPTHHYAAAGDYVITLTVDGTMGFYGRSSSNQYSGILRYSSSGDARNYGYWNAVQKIEAGGGVTSIGSYAFCNCRSLESIKIPDSVTSIGSNAFEYCSSLASITIHGSVTRIDSYTFRYCYSLASITIPDSVTNIGVYAFSDCSSLASIKIPDSTTIIDSNAFASCYRLASITIPDSVTSIGSSAFNYCHGLASITIPGGVTSIGSSAFSGCGSLASITIHGSVTKIDNYTFRYCYSLASIRIPDSVTSIGSSSFGDCYSLGKIRFESATPPTVASSNAFSSVPTDCVISVPVGSLAAYTSATNYPSSSTYTYIEEG